MGKVLDYIEGNRSEKLKYQKQDTLTIPDNRATVASKGTDILEELKLMLDIRHE